MITIGSGGEDLQDETLIFGFLVYGAAVFLSMGPPIVFLKASGNKKLDSSHTVLSNDSVVAMSSWSCIVTRDVCTGAFLTTPA
jgi:hypothetical protein